jgi:hypothetical protein
MLSILDPRLLLAAVLALGLTAGVSYFKGVGHGRKLEQAEHASAIAQANAEIRKSNELRQSRVDEVARMAAARETALRNSAALARSDVDRLRGTLGDVERAASHSLTTSNEALRVTSELLGVCSQRYIGVAEEAQRADSEARELRAGWPN